MPSIFIDNSLDLLNIAVADNVTVLAQQSISNSEVPSSVIAVELSRTLERAGIEMKSIGTVFATLGPGSFTGIRVSLAFCKGICAAMDLPLIGVPTLDVLAQPFSTMEGSFLCPLIDAKKGEVFTCLYHVSEGVLRNISGYRSLKPADVPHFIRKPCICFGTGTPICEQFLVDAEGVRLEKNTYDQIRIPAFVSAGNIQLKNETQYETKPIYGRKSEAEIKFNLTVA
ncbi:MAG TPA: tRNA (adenosine(37)-N6)-threonylcarbamoyltransferase complex dimerization subunit type 1 TsaB [Syntrophorhabdaceae bacterium]|nr:tRNA (adenosine(37)-N6)-threonylcarbamoyltransferase complex dimerization subunit type 1 TsaB [Syntrophorhabdaceae bacterium]